MALSPWPDAGADRDAAVARLSKIIAGRTRDALRPLDVDVEETNALGATASAMVEDYAPGAPQALRDEALIRFAGYLAQSDFGAVVSEKIGPVEIQATTNHANAWRNSGAGMLLTRWRVRRAGSIK